MRPVPARNSALKGRTRGRHAAAASLTGGIAGRARRAAPAVAVLAALMAAPSHQPDRARSRSADTTEVALAGRMAGAPLVPHRPVPPTTPPAPTPTPAAPSPRRTARPAPASPPASPSSPAAAGGPSCSGAAGPMLPANYAAIVDFLTSHGYTGVAAAGIAGNIYQESMGNPESVGSGGGGLIGWTPLPPGLVTGNPAADLQAQLEAILTFNQQWSAYLPALNGAGSAAAAADIYVTDFERAGIPAAGNREAAATAVAAACGL